MLVSGHADALRREDDLLASEPGGGESASQLAKRLMNSNGVNDPAKETTVASYAAHDIDRRCFGERALLQAVPRAASVVTRSPCVIRLCAGVCSASPSPSLKSSKQKM